MANKLIRTVKQHKTVNRIVKQLTYPVTVFMVTTYGYRQDKTVSSNIVQDMVLQIFEGIFYNYQLPLRENQKAEIYIQV